MEGLETISSAADLTASVSLDDAPVATADTGAPAGDTFDVDAPGMEGDPTLDELNAPGDEESADGEQEEEPAAPAPDAAAAPEELPDGVRKGKDRNGKDGYWLNPNRYETFHGAHKTLRTFEELAGEQMTPEAFDLRQRAFEGQEKLYGDLLSGDPTAQTSVFDHFIAEASRAVEEGAVGSDPMVGMATSLYSTIQQKSPEAYAALRSMAAKDLVDEMYREAGGSNNRNLWLSMGHVAKALGMQFQPESAMAQFTARQNDPVASIQAENQRLREQLNGRTATNQAAQFDTWQANTRTAVTSSVHSEAVLPALSEERKAWEKFPTQFDNLVIAPLNRAVRQTIAQDKGFNSRIELLEQQARRAPSEQRRAQITAQIKQAYVDRAKFAVESHKRSVLNEAAVLFKEKNDATHERRATSAQRRAPGGGGNPVKRSLIPDIGNFDVANPGNLRASLDALLS